MEEKLKKQRNKLFTRIILILLTAWLVVSAAFCAVRLNIEKANAQSDELSKLSHFSQLVTAGNGDLGNFSWAFIESGEFFYDKSKTKQNYDSQMVFTDRNTGETILDTAGKIGVQYSIRLEDKSTFNFVTLLDYDLFRGSLSDEQLDRIKAYLDTQREDGNYYDLVCTKMHCDLELVPLELRIVLVNGKDDRLIVDDNVESFDLSANQLPYYKVYESSTTWLNSVPKSFLFDSEYGSDYIGSLTREQQKSTVEMIPTGILEYTFYAFDYVKFTDDTDEDYEWSWRIQYAKDVNLLDRCKTDLLIGVGVIFFFFLTISVILCVMIWRTVKAQIIGEQKRLDLTNALAHDIKTPLFVISGYAYSLKEDIDAEQRETYLDRIIEQTDTVNDLVHRMLSFSKLDSYSMELNQTDFDLRETVEEHFLFQEIFLTQKLNQHLLQALQNFIQLRLQSP